MAELRAAAGDEFATGHLNFAEGGRAEGDDHAGNAFIADENVGAAAEDTNGQVGLTAAADERGELLAGCRLGEELGRAAEPEPGVRPEGLVFADDMFETGGNWHAKDFNG